MNNNPLAKAISVIFEQDIIQQSCFLPGNAENPERVVKYAEDINRFFSKSGLDTFEVNDFRLDEKRLMTFSLQLSGYIRDAQKALDKLKNKFATDKDLIDLYRASAHYTVACSGKVAGNKYVFTENNDYCAWKIENPADLSKTQYTPVEEISSQKKCVLLSMPFHIRPEQSELQKWTYLYMHDIFANEKIFGQEADVYMAHFPIEQPRGEKFSLALETIRQPQSYYAQTDMNFVQKHLMSFLGENLELDENNRYLSGRVYSPKEFKDRMKNLVIVGYCAGMHHAHRWVNALEKVAENLYSKEDVKEAFKNMFMLNYAALPLEMESKYSGAHFISNYEKDTNRKEPFVKMFRPELYEKVKYEEQNAPARITTMPDKRNFVVSFKLAPDLNIIEQKQKLVHIPNQENGHHISFVTAPNISSEDNFPYYQFRTVLENVAQGKRGIHIFDTRDFSNPAMVLKTYNALAARQSYRS